MEYRRQSNGLTTLVEHSGLLGICVAVGIASELFISLLSRVEWCLAVALSVAGVGVGLIFLAKLPLYRQRRFFTFGSGVLPPDRRSFYLWGYGCVILAAAVLLGLSVANP